MQNILNKFFLEPQPFILYLQESLVQLYDFIHEAKELSEIIKKEGFKYNTISSPLQNIMLPHPESFQLFSF